MTTLPQTTSVRLPRPPGNGAITSAAPGIPMIHSGVGAPAAGASMSGGDIWRVIRANSWLIILMLIVSGVAGYFCNWYLLHHYPKYTATGILEVQPVSHPDPTRLETPEVDVNIVALEQKTQVAKLREGNLLTNLLTNESSEIRQTDWFKNVQARGLDFKDEFADAFSVVAIPETRYLKAEFTSPSPKDCQIIVREMCEEHIRQERQTVVEQGREQSRRLENLSTYYKGLVNDEGARADTIRNSISDGGDITGRMTFQQYHLERLSDSLVKAESDFHQVQAQYSSVQESLKKGIDPPMVQMAVDNNGPLTQQRYVAHNLESNYKDMLETYGDKYPKLIQVKKAWEREQAAYDEMEAKARSDSRNALLSQITDAMASATNVRDTLKGQVDEAARDIASTAERIAKYYVVAKKLELDTLERDRIDHQLELLTNAQEQKLNDKVKWASHPDVPSTPSFPKLKIILPIAMGIGLLLALGIAFLREMTDTTVRSDRDIVRVGQMQLLGMVGDESQDPQAAGARLPLVIFDAPHSMTAEQLRQVRTRLQHAASLDTTRSLLVTSPSPGDGKTTIACNLAAGLALNGRRILLVDANFRRPEIHKVFGIANEQGFSNVLNGALTFDEGVHETQVPNLAVMGSGPKPVNATEMFESQLLVDFIERAQEEFDHVIFDSGPMMVVSESAAMAPRVDGVVTVCRARGNSRGLLTRMRDTLRALKAEHLGVVLNGVRAQGGGYYGRNIKAFYEYQDTQG